MAAWSDEVNRLRLVGREIGVVGNEGSGMDDLRTDLRGVEGIAEGQVGSSRERGGVGKAVTAGRLRGSSDRDSRTRAGDGGGTQRGRARGEESEPANGRKAEPTSASSSNWSPKAEEEYDVLMSDSSKAPGSPIESSEEASLGARVLVQSGATSSSPSELTEVAEP